MATGSRKTTTSRTRKTTPARKRTAAAKKKSSFMRREAWAILYALGAIVTFLCLSGFDGAVLKVLRNLLGAMIGTGIYILPFSLAGLSALLLVQRKGPVRLRGTCIALLPLLIGGITQAVMHAGAYVRSVEIFGTLVVAGMDGKSAGLLGGIIYLLLEWAFSRTGAFIILLLITLAAIMIIFRLTPAAIWQMLKTPEYEYESEEERQKYEAPPTLPNLHTVAAERAANRAEKRVKRQIDIPLDDSPVHAPEKKPAPSPAEFLQQQEQAEEQKSSDAFGDIISRIQRPEPVPAAEEPEIVMDGEPQGEVLEVPSQEPGAADDLPPWEQEEKKKADKKKEAAQAAALAAEMTASQQAPVPAYERPQLTLLGEPRKADRSGINAELKESSVRLIDTLESFGIKAEIINIVPGPSVTRFEMTVLRGVKFSRITALADDIALALGAVSVRIAPIPDKVAIGIEVPNKTTETVFIRDVIGSRAFQSAKSQLSFAVGKDITGSAVIGDIARMPHMLIAGTTGAGKSVCINSMLISLLYKSPPEDVRLIMIDPKMVELGNYNGIPHLLIPVVTDPKKAAGALNWAVGEMERRYKVFAENQVRNLVGYNEVMMQKRLIAQKEEDGTPEVYAKLPQIVIVIDELADLMMVAAKEVETSICRIAQKARAAGMHLIVATQRPSADVITGIMKANIPSRIAFAVASQIESRIILDQTGAEKLIGKGDMLYAPLGEGKARRVQGCFISNDEIESVIAKIKENATPEYSEEILEHIEKQGEEKASGGSAGDPGEDEDELLQDAIDVAMENRGASTSMLQRRLRVGYSRAARIIDQMEERGIIGASEGSKPRQLLISREDWQEMKLRRDI